MPLRTCLILVSLGFTLCGQILYNPRQDQKAEEVRKLASEVVNGQLFQSQLDNLTALTKPASDRVFTSAQRAALAKLASGVAWSDIALHLELIKGEVSLQGQEQKAKWEAEKKVLDEQVKKAQAALSDIRTKDEEVAALASLLKEVALVDEGLQLANQLLKRDPEKIAPSDLRVVHELSESSGRLAELLESSKTTAPKSASQIMREIETDLKKAEIEHLTNLIKIETRRTAAMDDVRRLYAQAADSFACVTTGKRHNPQANTKPCIRGIEIAGVDRASTGENIETTLQRYTVRAHWYHRQTEDAVRLERAAEEGVKNCGEGAGRDCQIRNASLKGRVSNREEKEADMASHKHKLRFTLSAIADWAALTSRAAVPNRLADLRVAMEDRRYQIKRDSILARGYEMTLLSGAETLAAYSKSGVRAGNIAALVQAIGTLGLIPTIALK